MASHLYQNSKQPDNIFTIRLLLPITFHSFKGNQRSFNSNSMNIQWQFDGHSMTKYAKSQWTPHKHRGMGRRRTESQYCSALSTTPGRTHPFHHFFFFGGGREEGGGGGGGGEWWQTRAWDVQGWHLDSKTSVWSDAATLRIIMACVLPLCNAAATLLQEVKT